MGLKVKHELHSLNAQIRIGWLCSSLSPKGLPRVHEEEAEGEWECWEWWGGGQSHFHTGMYRAGSKMVVFWVPELLGHRGPPNIMIFPCFAFSHLVL